MALTDLYARYEFGDGGGPGCGVDEHGDDCLCDVDPAKCAEVPSKTVIGPMHKLAARVTSTPTTGVELERWAGELLGLADALDERGKAGLLTEKLEDARQRLLLKIQTPGRIADGSKVAGRYAWQAEVIELLRLGLTLTEIAAYVGVFVEDVCRCLNQGRVTVASYLRAEQLLRSGGAESLGHVAAEAGLSRYVVRRLADAIGVETKTKERLTAGGGLRYTAEQYEQVLQLRAEGMSYGKIEKLTGVKKTAAYRIVSRRAAA